MACFKTINMDRTVILKLEINLRKFSAITVATILWDHEKIKARIKKYFSDCKANPNKHPSEPVWQAITKQVSDQIYSLCLTEELKTFLQPFIKPIGEKIFQWNVFVHRSLTLSDDYAYKTYWTSFGIIDEIKIFEKHWVPIGKLKSGLRNTDTHDFSISLLACLFIQKKFIRENIHQITKEISLFLELENVGTLSVHVAIVMWVCAYCAGNETALDLYKKVKNSGYIILFMLCVNSCLLEATKYFWNKLTKVEKDSIITGAAERCVKIVLRSVESFKEKSMEILIFLINNMTYDVQKNFVQKNFVVLTKWFRSNWPFQEMIEQVVDSFINDVEPTQFEVVLTYAFLSSMSEDEDFFSKHFYRLVLPKIYKVATKDIKKAVLVDNIYLVVIMISISDLSYLTLILTDPDLSDYKEKILEVADVKFKSLIESKNFGLLNKFTRSMFNSKTEEKEFKMQINILQELIIETNFELADEYLNWLSDSDEEKIFIKQHIDPIKIYSQTKDFKYEFLDEILLWLYDTDEGRKNAKQAMKENEIFCNHIINIWNVNNREGKRKCLGFLKWLSDTHKEEAELKRRLTIDENFVKKFSDSLPSYESFRSIDDLFKFLALSPKKILKVKKKVIKNIDNFISPYVVTQNNFKLADTILNWVSIDQIHKKEIMLKYVNSSEGAMMLMKMFLNCEADNLEPLLSVFNFWIKLYGNENMIIEKLNIIEKENLLEVPQSDAVDRLVFLLGFTKTGKITDSFIKNVLKR